MNWEAISTLAAVLGLVGGAVGFVRSIIAGRAARGAQVAADDARSDAVAALTRSADAEARIARAIEIIAGQRSGGAVGPRAAGPDDLTALIPEQKVTWTVERRGEPGTLRLRNTGTASATGVTVTGDGTLLQTSTPRALVPGASAVYGPSTAALSEVMVAWTDAAGAHHILTRVS